MPAPLKTVLEAAGVTVYDATVVPRGVHLPCVNSGRRARGGLPSELVDKLAASERVEGVRCVLLVATTPDDLRGCPPGARCMRMGRCTVIRVPSFSMLETVVEEASRLGLRRLFIVNGVWYSRLPCSNVDLSAVLALPPASYTRRFKGVTVPLDGPIVTIFRTGTVRVTRCATSECAARAASAAAGLLEYLSACR